MSEPTHPRGSDPHSGRIGRYTLRRPLGKGAMGMVYLAHDAVLEREVALKVMVASIAGDPELKQRFEREAKAVARMSHPNIVTVHDLGTHEDGSPYIAMELLRGEDLSKVMRQEMTLERKVSIVLQVLAGLAVAHEAGIVHRDIKPANIFIQSDGSVKIMDFGVARLTTAAITGSGSIVGTADYMSPEQVRGLKVDGRSDLFSAGSVLYELLAGRRPFQSESLMSIFYKITHDEPDYGLVPREPRFQALVPVLKKALAKDLDARFQNAYQFAVALRETFTSASGAHALEGLIADGPPSYAHPLPMTDVPATTLEPMRGTEPAGGGDTVDLRPLGATQEKPRTRVDRTLDAVPVASPSQPTLRPAAAAGAGRRLLLGAVGVAVLAGAVVAWLRSSSPRGPAPTVVSDPAPIPAASARVATQSPSTAPPATGTVPATARDVAPSSSPSRGRPTPVPASSVAPPLRAAREALAAGDPARALAQARAALVVEPGSAEARQIADQAAAQIQAAQRTTAATQLNSLLAQAEAALTAQKYDQALALYDEALTLDPSSARAGVGRANTVGAKAVAQASARTVQPAPATAPVRNFVTAKTSAHSAETKNTGAVPEGFEDTPGVVAKRVTQAAEMSGRLTFEIEPATVKSGDPYKVRVSLVNEGATSIGIATMLLTTRINGRSASGAVPPLAKEVAPHQKAVLFVTTSDTWRDDVTGWSMEVSVHTQRGETYRSSVEWK